MSRHLRDLNLSNMEHHWCWHRHVVTYKSGRRQTIRERKKQKRGHKKVKMIAQHNNTQKIMTQRELPLQISNADWEWDKSGERERNFGIFLIKSTSYEKTHIKIKDLRGEKNNKNLIRHATCLRVVYVTSIHRIVIEKYCQKNNKRKKALIFLALHNRHLNCFYLVSLKRVINVRVKN